MDEESPENGDQEILTPARRIMLAPPAKLPLDGGNYAVLDHGIIQIYLKEDRHLFSVDANTVSFERKILGAMLQVYLLGFQNGKAQERASCKQRTLAAINLLFE